MRRLFFFALLIFVLARAFTLAQQSVIQFEHLTIDDGLSQNSVSSILQDQKGFMWFGTHDGLNRYDGYQFVHYRNERNNINSISNNYIYDVYEDGDGVLWFATFGGGLNSLNPSTGEIKRYTIAFDASASLIINRLFSICEYPEGILWIGCNEGLVRFDKETSEANLYLSKPKLNGVYEDNYVGIVTPDGMGNVWLHCDSGLTRFNTQALTAEYFQRSPFSGSFELNNIFDISMVNTSIMVLCTAGLIEVNPEQQSDTLLLAASQFSYDGQTVTFRKLLHLGNQRFAIGTNIGLIIFDASSLQTTLYQNDAFDNLSLSHNIVLSLCQSKDGVIWIGTRNGLNKLISEKPNFTHIRQIPGKIQLSSKNVSSFLEQADSLFLIGTTNGLNLYDKLSTTFTAFYKDSPNIGKLDSDYILCQFKDSKGNLYAGTRNGGFFKIENRTSGKFEFKRIQPVNDTTKILTVHYITEDLNGSLWIGTGGAGLWNYNPSTNIVKKYFTAKDGTGLSHPYVFTILIDTYQNIWLGTPSGGINLFNPRTEKFIYFQNNPENEHSINNNIILSFHEDSQNTLWVGTNDGLVKLIPKLHENIFQDLEQAVDSANSILFNNFGQEHGFPNTVIYGMLEDDHRNLWISTNSGLVVFNMDKEQVVRTYNKSDGLQSNEFNQNAYLKGHDGRFYFGGVNGASVFHPDSVKDNPYIPPVVITDLLIFNEPVKIGLEPNDKNYHLDRAVHSLERLDLSWKQDVITFEFAALNYISPEKNQYSYMLEGVNRAWVNAGDLRSATYTQLDPGNYIFKVRASNNDGIWNEAGTALILNVSTPPWLSWYAYLIYVLLLIYSVYALIRFRINRATREIKIQAKIEQARIEERERYRKESAADFHDEAGNKITKIALFTEMARTEIGNEGKIEKFLDKIQQNTTELSLGMRDFLWVMDPKNDSLFEAISRLKDFGDSILPEIGVQFTMVGMKPEFNAIVLPMVIRREVLQIFKEAIHNSAKYASASKVTLSVLHEGQTIEIMLRDNGVGFDPGEVGTQNNYGVKIMNNRASKIGARLEINSQKNQGTVISLKYNMPQMGNIT